MRKMKKILLTCMLCFVAGLVFTTTSEAAAKKPTCSKSMTRYYLQAPADGGGYTFVPHGYKLTAGNWSDAYYIQIRNLSDSAKVTGIKSSNSKVIKAQFNRSTYSKGIIVVPQRNSKGIIKEGTSKISFKVRQNGKTYKMSCKYTVKKTPSPLKSFKINGKQYASKLKGVDRTEIKTGKSSVKLSYSGNAIKNLTLSYFDSEGKKIIVKNNSKLSIPKEGIWLSVQYRYKGNSSAYKTRYAGGGYETRSIFLKK